MSERSNSADNKRIAKNTLMLYFRMFLIMAVTLYTSRVILQALGNTDFGIYNVVGGVVAMFGFINGAMTASTQRFITFFLGRNNKEELHNVFCTAINIHALISLIVLLFAETVGLWFLCTQMNIPAERFDAAMWVYQMSVASSIVLIMSVPYNSMIVAHERMSAFAYISVLEVFLKLAVVYLLSVGGYDKLKLYAVLMFLVQLFIRITYGNYCKRHFCNVTKYKFFWNKSLCRDMTGMAGWGLIGDLSYIGLTQGVNILLNLFFGPAMNTARAIAVQVQAAAQSFYTNFQVALNPQITKSYATKDLERMHDLIVASSKYSFFLLLLILLPVFFEAPLVLSIWLGHVPDYTVLFVRWICGIVLIDVLSNPLIISAKATGQIRKYQLVVGGLILLVVPLVYVAFKLGGSPEFAFAIHFLIFLVAQFARLIILRSLIHLSLRFYFKKVVVPVLATLMASLILPLIVEVVVKDGLGRLCVIIISSVIGTVLSIYVFGLRKREREFISQRLINFLQKKRG